MLLWVVYIFVKNILTHQVKIYKVIFFKSFIQFFLNMHIYLTFIISKFEWQNLYIVHCNFLFIVMLFALSLFFLHLLLDFKSWFSFAKLTGYLFLNIRLLINILIVLLVLFIFILFCKLIYNSSCKVLNCIELLLIDK